LKSSFLLFFLLCILSLSAQNDSIVLDTTVYAVADEMPRFPNRDCELADTTIAYKNQCAQAAMLRYIANRSLYPQEAREKGIQGTPVVTFVVESDGIITQPQVVRDPGGQLGLAALQAVLAMSREVRWRPAIKDGKSVRFRFTLPVRFKLEDPKPYRLAGLDTVYTDLSKRLDYEGGSETLGKYFTENLDYPEFYKDSCWVGQIDLNLLVQPDNIVRILNLTDYSDLGFDFWYEAIHAATSTYGSWIPAEFEGRKVPAAFDVSMTFLPVAEACQTTIDNYSKALELANTGNDLIAEKKVDEGFEKLTAALELFPYDGQLLIARGQALLDANRLSEACGNLALARRIALVNWFDSILPLICR
jgi:TonB family protein